MPKIFTVKFPDIGEGVVEGEVVEWLKKPGDSLAQDEHVVVVMTDKATVELPSPYPGKLVKQYVQPGQMAIKDKPLYDIETEAKVKEESVKAELVEKSAPVKSEPRSNGKVLATPVVRKLAKDMNIAIEQVKGTGKDGRVTTDDLKKHTSSSSVQVQQEGDEERPLIGIRHLMAKKMAESKRNIPHFSYFEQIDATRLIQLKEKVSHEASQEGIKLTYMPFLIRALSLTISKYPEINSTLELDKNKLIIHHAHHIGIAVATSLGLIVPVLKDVQRMSLRELIAQYNELKQKAMENRLHPNDMKGATITISNFGVAGGTGLWATPIINFPEVSILAVARIQKQPLIKNDSVVVRDALNLSWSFDHRVIDGDTAAHVSRYYASLIHNPASLL